MKWNWGIVIFVLVGMASPAFAQTIELQQGVNGYEGTADAHIISWDRNQNMLIRNDDGSNGGNNDGPSESPDSVNTGEHIFVEEGDFGSDDFNLFDDSKAILIKFDLDGISGTATSAQIGLYYWYERSTGDIEVEGSGDKQTPHDLNVNRILKRWAEGTDPDSNDVNGTDPGTPDNSGAVTWNSTGFEFWQAMGAEGPGDIAPTESVTNFDPAVGEWTWFDVTESVNIWLADPSTNHGVKIGQEEFPENPLEPDITLPDGTMIYSGHPDGDPTGFAAGAHNFVSSENNDMTELRPKLVIEGASAASHTALWSLYQ